MICALVTRAISRAALKPYDALADHLERLEDGSADGPVDLQGPVAGVRRLARAVVVFQQRAVASQRSEAALQARYDSLYQEHAEERRLLMGMLVSRRLESADGAPALQSPVDLTLAEFDIPEPPAALTDGADRLTPHTGQVVDLTGRLRSSARQVDDRPAGPMAVPDLMPLDFVFVRR